MCCLISKAALKWQAHSSTVVLPNTCFEYLAGLHVEFGLAVALVTGKLEEISVLCSQPSFSAGDFNLLKFSKCQMSNFMYLR